MRKAMKTGAGLTDEWYEQLGRELCVVSFGVLPDKDLTTETRIIQALLRLLDKERRPQSATDEQLIHALRKYGKKSGPEKMRGLISRAYAPKREAPAVSFTDPDQPEGEFG